MKSPGHFSLDIPEDRAAAIAVVKLLNNRGLMLRRECELALAPDVPMWRTRRALTALEMAGWLKRSIYTDRYLFTEEGEHRLALTLFGEWLMGVA